MLKKFILSFAVLVFAGIQTPQSSAASECSSFKSFVLKSEKKLNINVNIVNKAIDQAKFRNDISLNQAYLDVYLIYLENTWTFLGSVLSHSTCYSTSKQLEIQRSQLIFARQYDRVSSLDPGGLYFGGVSKISKVSFYKFLYGA